MIGIVALLISILLPELNRARNQAATVRCLADLRQIGNGVLLYANGNHGYLVPGTVRFQNDGTLDRDNWATLLVAGKYLAAPPQPPSTAGNTFADSSYGESVFRCPAGLDDRSATNGVPDPVDSYAQVGAGFFRLLSSNTAGKEGVSPGLRIDTWYGINGWTVSDTVANMKSSFDRWPFTRIPDTNAAYAQQLHKLSQFKYPASLVLIYDGLTFHNQKVAFVNARHGKRSKVNMVYADGHASTLDIKDVLALSETRLPSGVSPVLKRYAPGGTRFILRPEPGV